MGLRKDLDSIKKRCIYTLSIDDKIIYIGTACNPRSRYQSHLKRSKTESSLLYRFIRASKQVPKMTIISEIFGTYEMAEKEEIRNIELNSDTCLNFYNNPNKNRYNELDKQYAI